MRRFILFCIIVLLYFFQFVIYRHFLSMNEQMEFRQLVAAYLSCGAAALVLASLVFVCKTKLLHILMMSIVDIWLLANCIYTAANNVWIDWQVILNADQIRGFETSVLSYLQWKYVMFPFLFGVTIYILCLFRLHDTYRLWRAFGIVQLVVAFLYISSWKIRIAYIDTTLTPIRKEKLIIKTHSPIVHLLLIGREAVLETIVQRKAHQPLTPEERRILSSIYKTDSVQSSSPKGHLVFVLVESFESWALEAKDVTGRDVCPSLNRYIKTHDVLYSGKVISQHVYGRSGDGQLITQTGLLPLSHGITCMQYGENVYPNLAHFYADGVVLNPFAKVWNSQVTTYSYGFKRLREPSSSIKHETDSSIFVQAREELEKAYTPICVLAITLNTHVPFLSVPPTIEVDKEYSAIENRYLQCAHYLDTHLGNFLAWADTAKTMVDATIVITADHNHFPKENGKGVCPLIIRSPAIKQSTRIVYAYQMDIFPTVLHAIGQSNYAWHGFGIDLLDSTAVRAISQEEAYSLSEKIIRTNFFEDSHEIKESSTNDVSKLQK